MSPRLIFVLLLIAVVSAEPQYGFGFQNVPSAPADFASLADPAQVLDWTQKIQGLAELTKTTLTAMGKIALADDPQIGARIVATLNGEIGKIVEIVANFVTKYARGKRDVSSDGKETYNSVATTLVNSNKKIDGDKKKLKRKAQKDIDKEYRKGVDKCPADPCVSTSKALAEADDAEDERQ